MSSNDLRFLELDLWGVMGCTSASRPFYDQRDYFRVHRESARNARRAPSSSQPASYFSPSIV